MMLTMVIARSLRFSAAPAPHRRNASARLCSSDSARRNTTRVVSSSSSVSRRREATSRHRRKAAKANLCRNPPGHGSQQPLFATLGARGGGGGGGGGGGTRRRGGRRRREVKHAVAPREKMVRRARPVAQRRESGGGCACAPRSENSFHATSQNAVKFFENGGTADSTVQYPSCPRARVQ